MSMVLLLFGIRSWMRFLQKIKNQEKMEMIMISLIRKINEANEEGEEEEAATAEVEEEMIRDVIK